MDDTQVPDGKYTVVDRQRNEPRIVTVKKGRIAHSQRPDGTYYIPRGWHRYQIERQIRETLEYLT